MQHTVSFPSNPDKAPTFSGGNCQFDMSGQSSPASSSIVHFSRTCSWTSRYWKKQLVVSIVRRGQLPSPRHKETIDAFWDRFEQILDTDARLRQRIHTVKISPIWVRSDWIRALSGSHIRFDRAWIMARSTNATAKITCITARNIHATCRTLQTIARSYQSAKQSDLKYCSAWRNYKSTSLFVGNAHQSCAPASLQREMGKRLPTFLHWSQHRPIKFSTFNLFVGRNWCSM